MFPLMLFYPYKAKSVWCHFYIWMSIHIANLRQEHWMKKLRTPRPKNDDCSFFIYIKVNYICIYKFKNVVFFNHVFFIILFFINVIRKKMFCVVSRIFKSSVLSLKQAFVVSILLTFSNRIHFLEAIIGKNLYLEWLSCIWETFLSNDFPLECWFPKIRWKKI